MEQQKTHLEGFLVTGIAIRTTNQGGQAYLDISELWGKFMGNQLAETIGNKLSDDIYCVYTDYESDHTGYYTVILGCKVGSADNLEGGFTSVKVPPATYQVYKPEGELPDSIITEWEYIWEHADDRAYTADFECYRTGAAGKSEAEIYISIK